VAFTQVVDDAPSSETTNTRTHVVPLPSGSGGLSLVVASVDGNPTISNLPWGVASLLLEQPNSAATTKLIAFYKYADGSEAASTFTTSVAENHNLY
jgi:hypothetical protein